MAIQLAPGEIDVRMMLDGKMGTYAIPKERHHSMLKGYRLRVREPRRNGESYAVTITAVTSSENDRVFHATKDA